MINLSPHNYHIFLFVFGIVAFGVFLFGFCYLAGQAIKNRKNIKEVVTYLPKNLIIWLSNPSTQIALLMSLVLAATSTYFIIIMPKEIIHTVTYNQLYNISNSKIVFCGSIILMGIVSLIKKIFKKKLNESRLFYFLYLIAGIVFVIASVIDFLLESIQWKFCHDYGSGVSATVFSFIIIMIFSFLMINPLMKLKNKLEI